MSDIDDQIRREHQREMDAYTQGQDGLAEWYAFDIERLKSLARAEDVSPLP